MKTDADTAVVRDLLTAFGFGVEPIRPSSHFRTPDLRSTIAAPRCLIEVRAKEDDQRFRDFLETPAGTPHPGPSVYLTKILEDKWFQLRDYSDRRPEDLTVVWFIAHRPHRITVLTPLFTIPILYGSLLLRGTTTSGEGYEKLCYFLQPCLFEKYSELDGVVVQDGETLTLCTNSHSPKRAAFHDSGFVALFRKHFKVIDPFDMEAARECFVADSSASGNLNDAVGVLKVKSGLATVVIEQFVLFNAPVD